jgi:protein tyrosine/serine phosphatase
LSFSRNSLPAAESDSGACGPGGPEHLASITAAEIPNFHRVDSNLYRGARPRESEEVYLKLARLGIRSILNLEREAEAGRERSLVELVNPRLSNQGSPRLEFISFPIGGSLKSFVTGWAHLRLRELFKRLGQAPKPIFLHCHYGKDRTGAVVIVYKLRLKQANSLEESYQEARRYGFGRWDFGLRRTIRRYQDLAALNDLPDPGLPLAVR